jgi:hypothetical protein
MLMRLLYVVVFLIAFITALTCFQRSTDGPVGPEYPIEARVVLQVPGMT